MESREVRDGREGTGAAAAGCLVAAVAAATGFGVWFAVARSGVIGGFEDQRDWSLLYIELPGMVAGFPLIALLTWSLTRAVFRGRGRRGTRAVVIAAVVALTLLLLSWACGVWLEHRVDWIAPDPCSDPPC
ncbi:hypothetical protein G4Z16_16760 [Streptomyces bathyalis]|uniref:Uncharacterized protein n=1 Tax=Streptomyces bathyalis TaxID=2710756 RepID=A0A7T1T7G7_9ACTN|nr:hypothetical protein [Streptomyces bathyalis]QPP07776.1 hypothetical protein G4Z16_16760 [Streptomyces bathyalis]